MEWEDCGRLPYLTATIKVGPSWAAAGVACAVGQLRRGAGHALRHLHMPRQMPPPARCRCQFPRQAAGPLSPGHPAVWVAGSVLAGSVVPMRLQQTWNTKQQQKQAWHTAAASLLPPWAALQECMRILPVSADSTEVEFSHDIQLGGYTVPAGCAPGGSCHTGGSPARGAGD